MSHVPPLNDPSTTSDDFNKEHSDTDSILAELEASLDLSPTKAHPSEDLSHSPTTASILAARKAELQSRSYSGSQAQPQSSLSGGHVSLPAQYRGLQRAANEEALIRATADAPAAVVVFYSQAFSTSIVMKDNITVLAREYASHQTGSSRQRDSSHNMDDDDDDAGQTVFFGAEAEKCEWLCRKLKIQVLPVVVGYVDGKEVGRIVGFDGLKGGEKASWRALAWVIGTWTSAWKGTFAAASTKKGNAGLFGNRWEDWVGEGSSDERRRIDGSDSEREENDRNSRRAAGYVGGGGGSGRLKIGGRLKQTNQNLDEDDDWD